MQKLLIGILALVLVAGCRNLPDGSESVREVVHAYLGADVGTAGPFYRGAMKEIGMLSAADQSKVEALINEGAAVFLVFGEAGRPANSGASRVIVVKERKVIGDFRAAAPAP